ncbi:12180_t:CDS:2 [Racocetra fulgida]|uniref:12180_t:CDS:1 n=1 Tax=Racocetra fulgida TaxID=60492 RepID=A0A9N9FHJ6_9GLOM|nr:12180_t:CDS:2 [Racocetra fulgida]
MTQPINQTFGQPSIPQNVNIPINQTVVQPLITRNINTPVNSSFDNLTAEQRYKILTEGTDPFTSAKAEGTENQAVYQFPDVIVSGSHFVRYCDTCRTNSWDLEFDHGNPDKWDRPAESKNLKSKSRKYYYQWFYSSNC